MIAKSSPLLLGERLYTNQKPKALGSGTERRKPKGEGLYMNRKPKALGEGVKKRKFTNVCTILTLNLEILNSKWAIVQKIHKRMNGSYF